MLVYQSVNTLKKCTFHDVELGYKSDFFHGHVDPTPWFPENRHDFEVQETLIPNMCVKC